MEKVINKYYIISAEKEQFDTLSLIDKITADKWIDNNTIIVNCSPDYSSSLTQILNHRASYLNQDELFEVIGMEMPYPTFNQIWNPVKKEAQSFDSYLKEWMITNVRSQFKYLFVDSCVLRGKNFNKVYLSIRPLINRGNFKFASLYVEEASIFTPDYYIEKFDQSVKGGLLFSWENADNPNWNY